MERMPHGLENATHFLLWGLIFCKCGYYNIFIEIILKMSKKIAICLLLLTGTDNVLTIKKIINFVNTIKLYF